MFKMIVSNALAATLPPRPHPPPYHPHQPSIHTQDESVRLWNISTRTCVLVMGGIGGHKNEVLSLVRWVAYIGGGGSTGAEPTSNAIHTFMFTPAGLPRLGWPSLPFKRDGQHGQGVDETCVCGGGEARGSGPREWATWSRCGRDVCGGEGACPLFNG